MRALWEDIEVNRIAPPPSRRDRGPSASEPPPARSRSGSRVDHAVADHALAAIRRRDPGRTRTSRPASTAWASADARPPQIGERIRWPLTEGNNLSGMARGGEKRKRWLVRGRVTISITAWAGEGRCRSLLCALAYARAPQRRESTHCGPTPRRTGPGPDLELPSS